MCIHPWYQFKLSRTVKGGAPSNVVTADSLNNQADYVERSAVTYKKARQALDGALKEERAFTSALRCHVRDYETNPGYRPRTPRQCLMGRVDLGEGLVWRARIKARTLTWCEEFVEIKEEATGLPIH